VPVICSLIVGVVAGAVMRCGIMWLRDERAGQ